MASYNEQGLLQGTKQEFDEKGILRKQSVYENNVLKTDSYLEIDENSFGAIVFEENFKNNERHWLLETNESISARIKLGALELVNKKKNNYAVFSARKIDSVNFSIETKLNSNYLTPESKSGIIFGFKDWGNYNYFYVSKFRYHVGSVQNGVLVSNIENYFSFELNGSDWNRLKVLCTDDSLYYYINNTLQSCCPKTGFTSGREGLYINNGNSLFDNFIIKQYANNFKGELQPKMSQPFNNYRLPVKQINLGVLLGKNGYLLTYVKDFEQVNKLIIELNSNDSIKQYEADVILYQPLTKLLVLKIKNGKIDANIHIAYGYHYMKNCNTEKLAISFSPYSNSGIGPFFLDTVRVNSMRINSHDHHLNDIANNHPCVGSPLFNAEGNILGIITEVNKQNDIKVLSMQEINTNLFSNSKTIGIHYNNNVDVSTFIKNVTTNIVLIKTF